MSESAGDSSKTAAAPLVFIHDAAIDDFVATLLLESMPGYDLQGIVIANADCVPQWGYSVAAQVNAFMGRPDLPLGLSSVSGWNAFPWQYREDCIKLAGIPSLQPFPPPVPPEADVAPPSGDDLLEGLLEKALASGTPITVLLTTGFTPLTYVLGKRPELAAAIGQISWMGGALNVAGNLDPTTIPPQVANKHAEWNVFWDPFAADQALATLTGIADFPLDITNSAAITPEFMATLKAQGAAGDSFSQFAFEAYGLVAAEPFYDMWDVVATVWLGAPQLYSAPESTPLQVVQWGFEQGWMQSAPDSGRPAHDVYLSFADQAGFYDYVTAQLARSA